MEKNHKKKIIGISFFIILLCLGLNFLMEKQAETQKQVALKEEQENYYPRENIVAKENYAEIIQETVKEAEIGEKKEFWHEVKVRVEEEYTDAYIVLFYTQVKNTPVEAVLYNPDFTHLYSAISINEAQNGEILFEISEPQQGEWTVLVLDEKNMGTYRPYVIEKNEYEKLKIGGDEEREVPY